MDHENVYWGICGQRQNLQVVERGLFELLQRPGIKRKDTMLAVVSVPVMRSRRKEILRFVEPDRLAQRMNKTLA